ncbi:hypothetical protein V5O48_018135 [Marasmius crinis-equi]|uniref:Uncharacterized protein n=1 Tax=Marasmius crinis-equi TaxID=585013 RepID=A0ABR3EM04_9AGAR
MTLFFPHGDHISTYPTYKPTGIDFPLNPDWNADTILDFARHVVLVPEKDLHDDMYPCEPHVFRMDGVKMPHGWLFYMTEGSEGLLGEGIYPDDDKARTKMPELPYFEEDDAEKTPFYLDDSRIGHETWVEGPFSTVEEAKEAWRKMCPRAHQRRWDAAHSDGRSRAAQDLKGNAYTAKCMMVIKAMAEVYPGIVIREIPESLVHPASRRGISPIYSPAFPAKGSSSRSALRPIVERSEFSLWVVTFESTQTFDSLRLAQLHAVDMSKRKKPFVVVMSRTERAAKDVFAELVGRMRDQANDEALARALAEKI